jgi:hypothetical protein
MTLNDLTKTYEGTRANLIEDLAEQALQAGMLPRAAARQVAADRALAALLEAKRWLTASEWAVASGISIITMRGCIKNLKARELIWEREAYGPELVGRRGGPVPMVYTWRKP